MDINFKVVISKEFQGSFQKLMRLKGLPAAQMFKIKGIAKHIDAEIMKYNETRNQIIEEVSARDENGNKVMLDETQVKIDESKLEEAKSQFSDLEALKIEIEDLKFSDLGKNPDLSAEDLYLLEFIKE